jgi:hypothetical protein
MRRPRGAKLAHCVVADAKRAHSLRFRVDALELGGRRSVAPARSSAFPPSSRAPTVHEDAGAGELVGARESCVGGLDRLSAGEPHPGLCALRPGASPGESETLCRRRGAPRPPLRLVEAPERHLHAGEELVPARPPARVRSAEARGRRRREDQVSRALGLVRRDERLGDVAGRYGCDEIVPAAGELERPFAEGERCSGVFDLCRRPAAGGDGPSPLTQSLAQPTAQRG